MSDEEKEVFDIDGKAGLSDEDDDISDIVAKYASKSDNYEGGYQDDISITPGYFNENEEELDPIALAKTSASSQYNPEKDAMEYAGENWKNLTPKEKEEIMIDFKNDHARNMGESIRVTPDQLQSIIKEGVQKLHRKTVIENRLQQINDELNKLNDQGAWDDAKSKAQAELEKRISTGQSLLREQMEL